MKPDSDMRPRGEIRLGHRKRPMTDTTTEAVERLARGYEADAAWYLAQNQNYKVPLRQKITANTLHALIAERDALTARVEELEAELRRWRKAAEKGAIYTRAELNAAVAAALEEAINRVNGCDRVSEVQPAIRALIEQKKA